MVYTNNFLLSYLTLYINEYPDADFFEVYKFVNFIFSDQSDDYHLAAIQRIFNIYKKRGAL